MSDPFVGQISAFGFNFPPVGWALCQGQTLPISQNTALFSLLGTQFGGNGTTTFQLPNLQGNVPVGQGTGAGLSTYVMGETDGVPNVTVTVAQTPPHNHTYSVQALPPGLAAPATGSVPSRATGGSGPLDVYATPAVGTATTLALSSIAPAGGNQPHNNMQPSLAINWCIALQGVFPSRS